MSDNIIFTATSNLLGYSKIQVTAVEAEHSILDGAFLVQTVEEGEHRAVISNLLSRNEARALRDALTKALEQMEITDIVRLLK